MAEANRHLNKMYVRWLDEIEDFRFDVTHLPGARNPSDPLSRRGFTDGDGHFGRFALGRAPTRAQRLRLRASQCRPLQCGLLF